MKSFRIFSSFLGFASLGAVIPHSASAAATISEIKVTDNRSLLDAQGDTPDWVEIYNPDAAPLDLTGYRLLHRAAGAVSAVEWAFPAGSLPAGGYRVIFASGKNTTLAGGEWHCGFTLKPGDFLELLDAAGEVVWGSDSLPATPGASSFGRGLTGTWEPLVASDAALRWAIETKPSASASPKYASPTHSTKTWYSGVNGLLWHRPQAGFELTAFLSATEPDSPAGLQLPRAKVHGQWMVPVLNHVTERLPTLEEKFSKDAILPGLDGRPEGGALVYRARTTVKITKPGVWTFAIHHSQPDEEGNPRNPVWMLKVGRDTFTNGGGGIIIDPPPRPGPAAGEDIIFPPRPIFDNLRPVNFQQPGVYPVELSWAVPTGAKSSMELSVAAGEQGSYQAKYFALVGSSKMRVAMSVPLPEALPIGTRVTGTPLSKAASLVTRQPTATWSSGYDHLRLKMRYADGFRAWLDGVLIAERNAPVGSAFASERRAEELMGEPRMLTVPLPAALRSLPAGRKPVLTLQVLRASGQHMVNYVHTELAGLSNAAVEDGYFATASPGEENGELLGPPSEQVDVSQKRGVYDAPFDLVLSSADAAGVIYFTTDGSTPQELPSQRYQAPLRVDKSTVVQAMVKVPGKLPSAPVVHSYLLPATQVSQSATGLPTSWGTQTTHYTFHAPALEAPGVPAKVASGLWSLPSISIVLPVEDIFGSSSILANPYQTGELGERPASVEWLFPSSKLEWRQPAGLRIKGEASRSEGFAKKGFRLELGSGKGDLKQVIYRDSDRDRHNVVYLHGSFVDNILTLGAKAQYTRDLWVRDTIRHMGWPAAHGDYAHLYLNGLYWGLYHYGERCDAQWCAHYYGGTASDWDVRDSEKVIDGTLDGYDTLMETARKENPTAADYAAVAQKLDLPSFADYMLVNMYAANTDWPSHNWYAARDRRSQVWRFISWDAEYSFDRPNDASLITNLEYGLGGDPGDLLKFLLKFPTFVELFGSRLEMHTSPGGALSAAKALATWQRRADTVAPAVTAEYARWSGAAFSEDSTPVDEADWLAERQRLERDWFPTRGRFLSRMARAIGYVPSVASPIITPAAGYAAAPVTVEINNTASNATLYYTTDGTDPRGADGLPAATAIRYLSPFLLEGSLIVKARGWYDGEASSLVEARYTTVMPPEGLHIREVYYRPRPPHSPLAEFVTILNTSATSQSLAGLQLTGGVRYTFTAGQMLPAGEYAILARDATAFQAAFPEHTVLGYYSGSLKDEGETVELRDAQGQLLDSFTYRPYEPWPYHEGSVLRYEFVSDQPGGLVAWSPLSSFRGPPRPIDPMLPPVQVQALRPAAAEPWQLHIKRATPESLTLSWSVQQGSTYRLEKAESLQGPWQLIQQHQAGQTTTQEMDVPLPGGSKEHTQPRGYFRVRKVED